MTANGDGLNFDFLDSSEPAKKPEPPKAPLPAPEPAELAVPAEMEGFLDDFDGVADDGTSSSIFDDAPVAPVKSVEEIPEAVPNVSDGETEILVRGRAELRDFTEEFGGGDMVEAAATLEAVASPEAGESVSSPPVETPDVATETVLQNPLGGQFLKNIETVEVAAPQPFKPDGDTVITEFSFQGQTDPLPEAASSSGPEELIPQEPSSESLPPTEPVHQSDETPVTEEPSGLSLDNLEGSGLSLSSVDSGYTTGATTTATVSDAGKPAPPKSTADKAQGGSKVLLFALGGYALMVTALCVLLLSLLSKARNAGQLESLPDLKPIPAGKIAPVSVDAQLPPGHQLAIGESQRYGNLKVEPVKVTRGPIQFQYFSKEGDVKDYQSAPVLKLWIRFTNESKKQAFVPLDGEIMFRRHLNSQGETDKANTFLVRKQDKPRREPVVYVFDHPLTSDWDMAGQQLGKELQPGESLETYIPTTEEGIERLKGDYLWRVQVRKGHSPKGNGVTTLVEVAFNADEIQSEGT